MPSRRKCVFSWVAVRKDVCSQLTGYRAWTVNIWFCAIPSSTSSQTKRPASYSIVETDLPALPLWIQHSTVWSSKPFTIYCPQRLNVASIECINSSACCSISVWNWVYLSILSTPLTLTYPACPILSDTVLWICLLICSWWSSIAHPFRSDRNVTQMLHNIKKSTDLF